MPSTYFRISLASFDTSLLPPAAREVGTPAFQKALTDHFAAEYRSSGRSAFAAVDGDQVAIVSGPPEKSAFDLVVSLLSRGRIKEGLPLMEQLFASNQQNADIAYNLGIAYNALNRFDEAIDKLELATRLSPTYARAWAGLGFALQRLNRNDDALAALNRAVESNPLDSFAHINLAGALASSGKLDEAVLHVRLANDLRPNDPHILYSLARLLEDTDPAKNDEVTALYSTVVNLRPTTDYTELASQAINRRSQVRLKAAVGGELRPDVVRYIQGTLQMLETKSLRQRQEIAAEIAMLGQGGFRLTPDKVYTLNSLPDREFSGLHLVSILYTIFKEIAPTTDMGVDFSAEYEMAVKLKSE